MGCGSPSFRLPDPLLCHSFSLTGSDSPSELFPFVHPGNCSERRGGRSACEGSCRACSFYSGLLQPPICYPQGHQGLAAGNRSLAPQSFGSCLPFSHGDGPVGSPVSSPRRLDGVRGSLGRVPPGSGAPVISALSEVLRGGFSAAVPRSLVRPFDCPSGVYTGHGPYLFHHAPLRFQDPALPGRLASPRGLVSGDSAGEGLSPLVMSGARCPHQSLQELSDSLSDFGLSGDEASDASFESFSNSQTCPEVLISASRLCLLSAAASVSVASATGGDVLSFEHRSGGLIFG